MILPICRLNAFSRFSHNCLKMASSTKGKGPGVSASSFLALKAEVSKQEDEFAKRKALGKGKADAFIGGVKRPEKVRYLSIFSLVCQIYRCSETNGLGPVE
jgi:hypothetical protein